MNFHLKNASRIAKLMDSQFSIFGVRFGLDTVSGLIPGFGDTVSLVLSLYLVWIGVQMKIPEREVRRMVFNLFFDYLVGIIPILGDIFDIYYKANIRNLEILKKYSKN